MATRAEFAARISSFRQLLHGSRALLPPAANLRATEGIAIVDACLERLHAALTDRRVAVHATALGPVADLLDALEPRIDLLREATKPHDRWSHFEALNRSAAAALPVVDIVGQLIDPARRPADWRVDLTLRAYHQALHIEAERIGGEVERVEQALRRVWRREEELIEQSLRARSPLRPNGDAPPLGGEDRPPAGGEAAAGPIRIAKPGYYEVIEQRERSAGRLWRLVAVLFSVAGGAVLATSIVTGKVLFSLEHVVTHVGFTALAGGLITYCVRESGRHFLREEKAFSARLRAQGSADLLAGLPAQRREQITDREFAHLLYDHERLTWPSDTADTGGAATGGRPAGEG